MHSDPARSTIHPTAVVNNAIFDTGGGRITVGEYVFVGHDVCVLAGLHEVAGNPARFIRYLTPPEGQAPTPSAGP